MSAATATIGAGFPPIGSWRLPQPGVSDAALRIGKLVEETAVSFLVSATGQARIAAPMSGLEALYLECQADNWDGEGAKAIPLPAFGEAQLLLLSLPSTIPAPSFIPERSGRIAFEWYYSPDWVFLVSAGGDKELQFAGLFGFGEEAYGRANFNGSLPQRIAENLRTYLQR
jgi:hypothetical protein